MIRKCSNVLEMFERSIVEMFKRSNVLGAGLPEEQVCWANKSKSLQLLNSSIILSLVARFVFAFKDKMSRIGDKAQIQQ